MDPLHPDLKGRVAVVTGASRGIGKALALRLARCGADVVIAAKSETSTEKLPGSIYDTAAEVRALGARALAVPADVRSDEAVRGMIEKTVAEFGRIDILINNAGALWWRKVIDTPPKRFDLMMGVNVRAAYLTSHYALPHMIRNKWGAHRQYVPGDFDGTQSGACLLHDHEDGDGPASHRDRGGASRGRDRGERAVAENDYREPGVDQLGDVHTGAVEDAGDCVRRNARDHRAGASELFGKAGAG